MVPLQVFLLRRLLTPMVSLSTGPRRVQSCTAPPIASINSGGRPMPDDTGFDGRHLLQARLHSIGHLQKKKK
ncbi:uncharacterized protein BCR38DRAFT_415924 [Pseudomassariella vexata]|uniref:Uncharacterized protein n=1 Tax=Pseudomassariella vexata TaxID=1141098 RepID=A0A1Y2EI28_9PEZI|nr:uncharacterized protein BCR38DRAFT_415924 [Pseudomassariella vexata]ORY71097.1 hypothetical protein BCR38DRAFT_415924 [Pseudomassariella vexata]